MLLCWATINLLNTLRPRQNGHHFPDDIYKCILLNGNVWIPIKISLQFVPKVRINNIPAQVQIMVSLLMHIYVTQWVKGFMPINQSWSCSLTYAYMCHHSTMQGSHRQASKISMIFQWYLKTKIPNFHDNSERYKMEKTQDHMFRMVSSHILWPLLDVLRKSVKSSFSIWLTVYQ